MSCDILAIKKGSDACTRNMVCKGPGWEITIELARMKEFQLGEQNMKVRDKGEGSKKKINLEGKLVAIRGILY